MSIKYKRGFDVSLTAAAVAFAAMAFCPAAWAQPQTVNVGALNLSPGGEIDFRLFGANGGQSDKYNVAGQFSSSVTPGNPGDLIVGFSTGDDVPLRPGTTFTLVTFGSTSFTAADSIRFRAAPRDGLTNIDGAFILNTLGGGAGSLQFTLRASPELPEPGSLSLLLPVLGGIGIASLRLRRQFLHSAQIINCHLWAFCRRCR